MHQGSLQQLAAGLGLAAGLAASIQAEAATIIELSDGVVTKSVTDGGVGDLSPTPGVVVFSGTVGVFDVNVTTGLTKPLLGSATEPIMDLNSVNVNSGAVGTLTVKLTSTDFVPTSKTFLAKLDVGGTTNGTITVDAFNDSSNTPFGTLLNTTGVGPFSNGPFADSDLGGSGQIQFGPSYSATIIATIIHDDASDVTSFDAEYRIIPEPGTVALIGLGGLLAVRRRRRA